MKRIQKGFTTLEMLLVIIILAIIGFTGYYVYHSKQQTDKTLNAAQSETSAVKVSKTAVNSFDTCEKAAGSITQQSYPEVCVTKSGQRFTQPTSPSPQSYLVIKEWSVKLPLSDTDSGAYYTYSAASGNQLADSVVVFDTSIDALSNTDNISCKDPGYPLLVISRIKPSDVPKTQDINSQYYIGDSGPSDFSAPSFSSQYEFAASTHNQAAPRCEILNNGTNDGNIGPKYSAIAAALNVSYSKMQQE